MGFRFRRSIRVIKGVRINISTTGASVSLGGRGGTLNIGKRGVRTTYDLPGSGAYYSQEKSWKKIGEALGQKPADKAPPPSRPRQGSAARDKAVGRAKTATATSGGRVTRVGQAEIAQQTEPIFIAPGARLDLNYFQQLSAADSDKALLAGFKAMAGGDQRGAFEQFCLAAPASADGAFMAGVSALQFGIHTDAVRFLEQALARHQELGTTLRKFGVKAWVSFKLTDEVYAHVQPDRFGALLALAEARQSLGDNEGATEGLRELLTLAPGDLMVRVALAELLADDETPDEDTAQELASLGAGIENDGELHCVLLLHQGRALMRLGLLDGAKDVLTRALSKRKDRSVELLCAIRYERAEVHAALGDARSAKSDFEKIYALDPEYEDVAEKLGRI
jgi:tetratricopeptide (TPR) repeat protein